MSDTFDEVLYKKHPDSARLCHEARPKLPLPCHCRLPQEFYANCACLFLDHGMEICAAYPRCECKNDPWRYAIQEREDSPCYDCIRMREQERRREEERGKWIWDMQVVEEKVTDQVMKDVKPLVDGPLKLADGSLELAGGPLQFVGGLLKGLSLGLGPKSQGRRNGRPPGA